MPRTLTHDTGKLKAIAREVREDILSMTAAAGSGHYMSSLSSVEILVSLYFGVMSYEPKDPGWKDRDRFVLSKGHASPCLYSVLARAGFFPVKELATLRKIGSRLQGHPVSHLLPGLDASSGSLGQGLSTAVGMALAARMDGRPSRVYVLLGDGELQEGQVWEAVMSASKFGLGNLTAIVDRNELQATGMVSEIMPVTDLEGVFRSFGWEAREVDGHDFGSLLEGFRGTGNPGGRPTVLVARTVKGCGVDFVENNLKYHSLPLTPGELERAMGCLK
ncbi:MAG TPA: transketolase [Methanomicrobiales archaeon]|nr:transketolase [Methanomicrobiales archaeon]